MIVIVMGVSGSGKTYLASKLAEATGWAYAEADDYHSAANKAKMHAGIPLTDEDRWPWLDALHQVLELWRGEGKSGILTCSALKAAYRARLVDGIPEARFVWLDPPRSVLADRMAHRPGHFMPVALLDSQLATLEPPAVDEAGRLLRLDGSEPVEREIEKTLAWLVRAEDYRPEGTGNI
jgi:gluconokinase